MAIIRNTKLCNNASISYPSAFLHKLIKEIVPDQHCVFQLVSSDQSVFVHSALLKNVSIFLADIIASCPYEANVLILPSSPQTTLDNLITLLYTGHISGLSENQARHVIKVAHVLGLNISHSIKDVGLEQNSNNVVNENVQHNSIFNQKLKVETNLRCKDEKLTLSFPDSRSNRDIADQIVIPEHMAGFEGRIQKEYNTHPIGKYMGPYDQNKKLKLKVQLPQSKFDFKQYTEFHHDGDKCFNLQLKSYDTYDDLTKIDFYSIVSTAGDEESDKSDDDDEDDRKFYTCNKGNCKIPCPCPQCHLDLPQCQEHKIKHGSLFNEKEHLISIRSSEEFCLDKGFFKKSYIVKFSGIPLSCNNCVRDLQFHHSYHFEYHEKCRFCKQSWFKHKAKDESDLKRLEKEEIDYFKRVCPFCDKQFIHPFHAKRHVENEHKSKKFQCTSCTKVFQSKQAQSYHEKLKHTDDGRIVKCNLCEKIFGSEVTLKNHLKYAHSDKKLESCSHCTATFKQKKNLRAHLLNIHSIDQMREKYCEDKSNNIFKCEDCDSEFSYKKSLKVHRQNKHEGKDIFFACDTCKAKFRYKHKLENHKKAKHTHDK